MNHEEWKKIVYERLGAIYAGLSEELKPDFLMIVELFAQYNTAAKRWLNNMNEDK
jgi:hypothetical protein